jgi:hypothetical protein
MKAKEKELAGYLKKSAGTTKGKAKADPVEKPPAAAKKPKKDDIPDVKKETIAAKADKKKSAEALDTQQVPKNIEKIQDLREYVGKWQKDRGFDTDAGAGIKIDKGLNIHDINHPLTYLSTGRTPESINKDYGHPGTPYKGKPRWAEEIFVGVAELSFLPKANRELVIDHILATHGNPGDRITKDMSSQEAAFYRDSEARKKDIGRMYDELQKAKPEHKAMLQQNNKRLYVVRPNDGDPWIDSRSESSINRKYKDPFVDFTENSEFLGRIKSTKLRQLVSLNNISKVRRTFSELVAEVVDDLIEG